MSASGTRITMSASGTRIGSSSVAIFALGLITGWSSREFGKFMAFQNECNCALQEKPSSSIPSTSALRSTQQNQNEIDIYDIHQQFKDYQQSIETKVDQKIEDASNRTLDQMKAILWDHQQETRLTTATTLPLPTPQAVDDRKSFTQLLIESGSDKYHRHHYERYYEKWFEPYRSKEGLNFLEIGVYEGNSLRLWDNYFDNPNLIMGLAYASGYVSKLDEEIFKEMEHVQIYNGDQSKKETMDYLKANDRTWDIIIDDGSHQPSHMVFSLFSLWSAIRPGGIYVIEDLETNYWPHGTVLYEYPMINTGIGADPEFSAVSKIAQLEQVLVRHQIGAPELSIMPGDHDICSIEWGMNLVVLRKCEGDGVVPMLPYYTPIYDNEKMDMWIKEAKRTNPDGFKDPTR